MATVKITPPEFSLEGKKILVQPRWNTEVGNYLMLGVDDSYDSPHYGISCLSHEYFCWDSPVEIEDVLYDLELDVYQKEIDGEDVDEGYRLIDILKRCQMKGWDYIQFIENYKI